MPEHSEGQVRGPVAGREGRIEFMDMQRRLSKFTFKCVTLRCEKRLLVAGKVP